MACSDSPVNDVRDALLVHPEVSPGVHGLPFHQSTPEGYAESLRELDCVILVIDRPMRGDEVRERWGLKPIKDFDSLVVERAGPGAEPSAVQFRPPERIPLLLNAVRTPGSPPDCLDTPS